MRECVCKINPKRVCAREAENSRKREKTENKTGGIGPRAMLAGYNGEMHSGKLPECIRMVQNGREWGSSGPVRGDIGDGKKISMELCETRRSRPGSRPLADQSFFSLPSAFSHASTSPRCREMKAHLTNDSQNVDSPYQLSKPSRFFLSIR